MALIAAGVITMTAGTAAAATLTVAPRKATFGCAAKEQFNSINAAVGAAQPGDTIDVCPGTYQETVLIAKPDLTLRSDQPLQATIKAPHAPIVAIVQVTARGDKLEGFTITNSGQTSSPNSIQYGVYISGGGLADVERNDISDISDAPISGDQNGVAVQAGDSTVPTTGSVILKDNTIENYQKNGVTVDGSGSYGDIQQNRVTGVGPTSTIAQNGIQVSSGASALLAGNTVNNNVYSPGSVSSTGILLCGAAFTDSTGNTLSTNDTGLYDAANDAGSGCPGAAKSKAAMSGNTIVASTFDGLVLDGESGAQVQNDLAAGTWGHVAYGPDQGDGFDVFNTTGAQLTGDSAPGNSEDGFHNESGSTGNTYRQDQAPANLQFDCEDDAGGLTNTWQNDLGDINLPPFICKSGSGSATASASGGGPGTASGTRSAVSRAQAAPKLTPPSPSS